MNAPMVNVPTWLLVPRAVYSQIATVDAEPQTAILFRVENCAEHDAPKVVSRIGRELPNLAEVYDVKQAAMVFAPSNGLPDGKDGFVAR